MPGLDAKPVIDILVGVGDLASSRACFDPIARRTHHPHLVPADSQCFCEELAFRGGHPSSSRS